MNPAINDNRAFTEQLSFAEQLRNFLRAHANLLLAGAVALLLLQDVFGTHGLLAMHRSHQQAAAVQKQIQQLNEENQQLQDQVKSLKSDPAAIEHIAREEMGLARPGEYIFKVTPPDSGARSNASSTSPSSPPHKP